MIWPATLALLVVADAACGRQTIDFEEARDCLELARAISDEDGGRLWGLPLYGPILLVDPDTRQTVANQADAQGQLAPEGDLFIGTLPDTVAVANTKTRWAGVEWTMLMWPVVRGEYRRVLVAHEMFHRIQDDLNLGLGITDCRHLDSRDGRLWMRMEWKALAAALEAEDDPETRKLAIEDALTFRAIRRRTFARRVNDERLLELNEGLAEYTGLSAGLATRSDRLAGAIGALQRYDRHPNFVRSFAYASGPAYGLLLDDAQPKWRNSLKTESDLGVLLGRAFRARVPANPEADVQTRLVRYDGTAVEAEEDERHAPFLALQAKFKARFTDGPTLILPCTEFPSYTFNPNGIKAYGEKGSVYLTTRVSTTWGHSQRHLGRGPAGATRSGHQAFRCARPRERRTG